MSAVVWIARLPLFPIHEVLVTNELHEVRRSDLEETLSGRLRGNFFSVNLEGIRQAVEQLPWVRTAEARRQWPSRIEISIEEHQPVPTGATRPGSWEQPRRSLHRGDDRGAAGADSGCSSVRTNWTLDMLGYYQRAADLIKPLGRVPLALTISPRLAVQMKLDDGMVVELGREQPKAPRTRTSDAFRRVLSRTC